ncbi:hypothetical protein ANCDUO_02407 [Ancylostoma duodenale]|uniref:Reverse transcriptase RNase H-like domain-containing protein n=1 Tax=Ancylostoma duodenale TaxID=51022 RepID=A0A0C2DBR6_9BILA|nr:hypothetical protein ANCDUO_02407 [Ancylostoma duodenale]
MNVRLFLHLFPAHTTALPNSLEQRPPCTTPIRLPSFPAPLFDYDIANDIDLSRAALSNDQKDRLLDLIRLHPDAFVGPDGRPGHYKGPIRHRIDLVEDAQIPARKIYRVQLEKRQEIEKQITQMLKDGIIRESSSPFCAPIVPVKKSEANTWRFTIDFRGLNTIIKPQQSILPNIQDIIDLCANQCLQRRHTTKSGKTKAIDEYATPRNTTQIKSSLRMCSFFIHNFANIASPLTAPTKKEVPFKWTPECESAMTTLKKPPTTAPILATSRLGKSFIIETDSSGKGVAGVLKQKRDDTAQIIAYASRTLNKHETRYPAIELEALGLVFAVQKFRPYIDGAKCTPITDHAPLKPLLYRKDLAGRLAEYQIVLQEFDIKIVYRPGKRTLFATCCHATCQKKNP